MYEDEMLSLVSAEEVAHQSTRPLGYKIQNGKVSPITSTEDLGAEFQKDRVVASTSVSIYPKVGVSTVFLVIDHGFDDGPPVLWETMIFGGVLDGACERYASEADAREGHARLVAEAERVLEKGPTYA